MDSCKMDAEELNKRESHKMKCKKCGAEYKYFEVIARMDSAGLPDNLVWINGCKNCGGMDYEEIA